MQCTEHFCSYDRGLALSRDGRFEAAITSFTKALNLQSDHVGCYVERAEAYIQLCDFRSAHLNLKKAYQLDPDNDFLLEKLAFLSYMEVRLVRELLYTDQVWDRQNFHNSLVIQTKLLLQTNMEQSSSV